MEMEPRRILVVDDELYVRDFANRALTYAGFEVRTAENGREALLVLRREPVDLVITDLVMPEFEGLELISELRRSYPALPVLAISGAAGGLYLKTARPLGAKAVLAKPFTVRQILEAVNQLLKSPSKANLRE